MKGIIVMQVWTKCEVCGFSKESSWHTWNKLGWLQKEHKDWCPVCEKYYTVLPPDVPL